MLSLGDITSFDVIIALLFLVFLVRGAWIGFMRQLAAFLALVGSYWLAGRYSGEMVPYVQQFLQDPKVVFLASFALLFMVSAVVFILAGKVLRRVMEITLMGWFDRFLGLLLGAVKAAVVAVLLFMVLASTLSSTNAMIHKSVSSPYLQLGADKIREIIADPKIRELFATREPAIKSEIMSVLTGNDQEPVQKKPVQEEPTRQAEKKE
jgi:membrane protein required for colicin V production